MILIKFTTSSEFYFKHTKLPGSTSTEHKTMPVFKQIRDQMKLFISLLSTSGLMCFGRVANPFYSLRQPAISTLVGSFFGITFFHVTLRAVCNLQKGKSFTCVICSLLPVCLYKTKKVNRVLTKWSN